MKHIFTNAGRKATAAALTAVILASTACGGGGSRETGSGGNSGGDATTTTAATTTMEKETLASAVDISALENTDSDEVEDPHLTYLGYYDIRSAADIDPIVRYYDKVYGGYEYEGAFNEATYEGFITVNKVSWEQRIQALQTLITSDDSPDLVDREGESFPMLVSKNVYEDLTDYIDLSLPQWAGFEQLIDQYEWNGKHVYYPWHVSAIPTYLFYSNKLFEEYGISPTPAELYDAGEWDWNAFRDCIKKFLAATNNSNAVGAYGTSIAHAAFASTGVATIGISDGKLINNFTSSQAQTLERAATFLEELRHDGLIVSSETLHSANPKPFINGEACFFCGGQDNLNTIMKKNDDVDVAFVPFPKDPSADKYYTELDSFGYLVPKGAKNIKGAAAFINIARNSKIDPAFRDVIDESRRINNKWTTEQIEFMKSFEDLSQHNIVADLYSGLDSDTSTIISDMFMDIAFHEDAGNWASIRDANMTVIDAAVNNINNG